MPEAVIVAAPRTPIGTTEKGRPRDTDACVLPADHVAAGLGGAPVEAITKAPSRARMIVTLVRERRGRGGGIGVAAMCAGGGMGSATVIEVAP